MADVLEVLILAEDRASKVFNGVGSALGSAFKIGGLAAAAGLTAFTAALGLSISEAMDAEAIQAELAAVIKSTGGVAGMTANEVNALADKLSRVTKFSDDTIVSASSMLLTFTKIGENIFPQATEATLNLAEKFGSVDQAAIQLGKALNDPIAGVTALRRVGVSLTEQQEAQIKAFMEAGDIASAQAIILKELETEFGGLARASGDTLGGKLTILKNRLLDVAEGIGMKLLPPLTDMVGIVLDKALPAIERLGEKLAPVFESAIWPIQRLFENLSNGMSIKDALVKLFDDAALALEWFLTKIGVSTDFADKFTDAFREAGVIISDFIFDKIVPFVKEHAEGFKAALIAIGAVLAGAAIIGGILAIAGAIAALFNPITLIIGGIALLAMAWQEDWGGIRTYITDQVWPVVQPILVALKDWFIATLPKAIVFLRDFWEQHLIPIWHKLQEVWYTVLKPALSNLAEWFITHIPGAIDALKGFWNDTLMPLFSDLKRYWDEDLKPVFDKLVAFFLTDVPAAIEVLAPKLQTTLKDAFNDAKTAASELWTILGDLASRLENAVKEALDRVTPLLDDLAGVVNDLKDAFDKLTGSDGGEITGHRREGIQGHRANTVTYGGGGSTGTFRTRDQGGTGFPGQLYKIGVPEFFMPGTPGTFMPLENFQKGIMAAVSDFNVAIERLDSTIKKASDGANSSGGNPSQTVNHFNLNVASNSSDERVISDFNTMRVWAGA